MQTSEIIFINTRLPTGTAFGMTQAGESVFVPAKITALMDVHVGERFTATLIENMNNPGTTPWMAIRIDRVEAKKTSGETYGLAELILDDLRESGSATAEEVAESIAYPLPRVIGMLHNMGHKGLVVRRTLYAITEDDFDGDDE